MNKLSREDVEKLQRDPLEGMKENTLDPRDVPQALGGDAPNPPGMDANGDPVDVPESEARKAPLRRDRTPAPLARSGHVHDSIEDITKR